LAVVRRAGRRSGLPGDGHVHRAWIGVEPAPLRVVHPAGPSPARADAGPGRLLLPGRVPAQILDDLGLAERPRPARFLPADPPPPVTAALPATLRRFRHTHWTVTGSGLPLAWADALQRLHRADPASTAHPARTPR